MQLQSLTRLFARLLGNLVVAPTASLLVAGAYLIVSAKIAMPVLSHWYWPPAYLWWAVVMLPITLILAFLRLGVLKVFAYEIVASIVVTLAAALFYPVGTPENDFVEATYLYAIVLVEGLAMQMGIIISVRLLRKLIESS